jgi:hypothetical protein
MIRVVFILAVVLGVILIGAVEAQATVVWNNGVSVQSTSNATVNAINSASGPPDNNRMSIIFQSGGSAQAVIRFSFPSGTGITNIFWLFTDGYLRDWTAQITAVNGTSVTSPTYSSTGNSSTQDVRHRIEASLAGVSGSTLSSIDVTFSGPPTTQSGFILVDTFGTPEPGTLVLFGLGLAGLGAWQIRRRRKARKA